MPKIEVITREKFGKLRWKRPEDFRHAASDAVVPLVVQELPRACLRMPTAFIEKEGEVILVAVQNIFPGKNLFVSPEGKWIGGYIPAIYRVYPFLLTITEEGKRVLCINMESGLVSETEGEPFFEEDGQPSPAIKEILNLLTNLANHQRLTKNICGLIKKYELLKPWKIKVKSETGEREVQGLFFIDEKKLNELPTEAFEELRKMGALPVIYGQLISMLNISKLLELLKIKREAVSSEEPAVGSPIQ